MCVTCLFGVQTLSLLSTRHVLSFQSIAIGVTQHKHTVPRQTGSSNANNWNGLGQHFNFLWFLWWERYVMNLSLQDRDWEFGWEGQMIGKVWSSKITM
jgi:hypothetical protein